MKSGEPRPIFARGLYAALATPRRPHAIEADSGALLDYVDAIARAGVNGLVLFGSTGEFIHFELSERQRTSALAIKRSRVPVLVNASHSTLAGAILLAEQARDTGAAGLLLTPPYFYPYGAEQIYTFYEQFLEQVGGGIPIYLYNLPMFVNAIPAQIAERLLTGGAFAGIKDSSGDWSYFERLLGLRARNNFQLLVGHEELYLRGRMAGADGAVSGVAAALPELMVALDRAVEAKDAERARQLDGLVLEFLNFVKRLPAPMAIRRAAAARGWQFCDPAVPFDAGTAAEVQAMEEWFGSWFANLPPECRPPAGKRG